MSLEELRSLPSATLCATLECAGNGRIFLVPQLKGAQWQLGAVSTAEWTGVPLATLLDRAKLHPDARELIFEGADHGIPREEPIPPGEIPYARSLALEDAGNVLIAYAMNGSPLSRDHGCPLRAIVPGHYGMASVKWLSRISAVTEPFRGYFQTSDYAYWDEVEGNAVRVPLGRMPLKSSIARPRTRESVIAGRTCRIFGAAWGGDAPIARVEVSTGNGATWSTASMLDDHRPFVWRRWEFPWQVPDAPGFGVLQSRAIDVNGNCQPLDHDKHFGSYAIHHTVPIEVSIVGNSAAQEG